MWGTTDWVSCIFLFPMVIAKNGWSRGWIIQSFFHFYHQNKINMRFTAPLSRTVPKDQFTPEKITFEAVLPLRLRNKVTGKGDTNRDKGCLHEIALVLACMEKNAFEDKHCVPEVQSFQKCYETYLVNKKEQKKLQKTGALAPGSKNLKFNQINNLLKRFPHV